MVALSGVRTIVSACILRGYGGDMCKIPPVVIQERMLIRVFDGNKQRTWNFLLAAYAPAQLLMDMVEWEWQSSFELMYHGGTLHKHERLRRCGYQVEMDFPVVAWEQGSYRDLE